MVKLAPRLDRHRADETLQTLREQTVVIIGTYAASGVVPRLAAQLDELRRQGNEVVFEVEPHPLHPVLTSTPGVGVRTAARLRTEVPGHPFPTSGHFASYANFAPATRRSNYSIPRRTSLSGS